MQSCGLYIVKDEFFTRFDAQQKLMDNKQERRPYYLGMQDKSGMLWLIPLSSQVSKYAAAIKRYEDKLGEGRCIFYYIAKVKGADKAFLIGDAFPCTAAYIKKPFTVNGTPYIFQNKEDIKALRSKLSQFVSLVRAKKLHPNANILELERQLKKSGEALP